jgi:hypothetical protein
MKELAAALMVWLSAHTGLPVLSELPQIETINRCAVQYIHNPHLRGCDEGLRAVAIYEHRSQTIILRSEWSSDDLYSVSVLLHMLVYHMQESELGALRPDECRASRAKVAYDAQIAFLEAAGVDAFEVMDIGQFEYFILTYCSGSRSEAGR